MTREEWARRKTRTSSWIRREKRYAIYHRDGHRCVYCRRSPADGARLSLDHLRPRWRRGVHHETNLVTACLRCNGARQGRSLGAFVVFLAHQLGIAVQPRAVRNQARRALDRAAGRALAEKRALVYQNVRIFIGGVQVADAATCYAGVG